MITMTTTNGTRPLAIGDASELAEWFIYHMPMDLRRRLMAERPLLYARVFPGINPAVLLERVARGLADAAEVQAATRACDADELLSVQHQADGLAVTLADPEPARAECTE
jgi:hypothetical protein